MDFGGLIMVVGLIKVSMTTTTETTTIWLMTRAEVCVAARGIPERNLVPEPTTPTAACTVTISYTWKSKMAARINRADDARPLRGVVDRKSVV